MTRLDFLKRAEWGLAVLLTATALFFLAIRATHAGALWRDECAVVNLARMPSVADITRNFQHEAFPVPFPVLVRAYTNIFGASDSALRSFGMVAGACRAINVTGSIWVATGLLTVDPDTPVGFDIYTRLPDGVAITNSGFASLVVGGVTGFYRINILTGQATLIDYFDDAVIDIAIPLNQ